MDRSIAARTRRPLISESSGSQLKSPVGLVLNALREMIDRFFNRRIGGDQCGQHGTNAGAADAVDFDAVLLQRAPDAKMSEAARTAAGEHQTDRFTCKQAAPGAQRRARVPSRT